MSDLEKRAIEIINLGFPQVIQNKNYSESFGKELPFIDIYVYQEAINVILKSNEDKQSRIDKAIKYIKNNKRIYEMKTPNRNRIVYKNCVFSDELLQILRGEDEDD